MQCAFHKIQAAWTVNSWLKYLVRRGIPLWNTMVWIVRHPTDTGTQCVTTGKFSDSKFSRDSISYTVFKPLACRFGHNVCHVTFLKWTDSHCGKYHLFSRTRSSGLCVQKPNMLYQEDGGEVPDCGSARFAAGASDIQLNIKVANISKCSCFSR